MPRFKSSISPRPSATARAAEPVGAAELDDVFAIYAGCNKIALAVSGGPDSIALLHLSLAWREQLAHGRPEFIVLTLDHGLRPEAAAEAEGVAAAAARLGLAARVLTRAAPQSRTALQARARADRYHLLALAARGEDADAIATGHTLDDQAETMLMRLARGSGIDGLSAMAPSIDLGNLKLLRPLLGLPKSRLEASLRFRGVVWTVDPSNSNVTFERPRLRAILPVLAAAGLSPEAIGTSARRLARSRAALARTTDEAVKRLVTVHIEGYFSVDRIEFGALSEEIQLRLVSRLIGRIGTPGQFERLVRLERLVGRLNSEAAPTATLNGCLVRADHDRILVLREPGRAALPRLMLKPGGSLDWDRRCRVSLSNDATDQGLVRALEQSDFHGELAAAARASGLPRAVVLTAPSVWRGAALLAMPTLGFVSKEVVFTPILGVPGSDSPESNDISFTFEPHL